MNAQQEFERDALVDLVATAGIPIQIVFAWKEVDGRRYRVERVQMAGDLPARFKDRTIATAEELRDQRVPRDYDPEWPLGINECFELANDPPVGGDLFEQLDGFGGLPWFDMKRRRVPNLYVTVAQLPDESNAFFGSRITARSVLRSGGLRAVWGDDTFSSLDQTVVTFPEGHDWVGWRNRLMILDEKGFHAVFRDVPALQNAVEEHVAEIVAAIPIVNQAAFSERCRGNVAMMTKLKRVAENQLYLQPVERLREYAREYHIEVQWDGSSLVFDGALDKQWNILKLLDEAGTLGPVSGKKYEVAAKVEI
jgi:hypothetical protein